MLKTFFKSHPIAVAFVLMFITLFPVLCMRDVSPSNELRYLSIADEAIANGDVMTFTNQGKDYADKPPLYFWLIMLSRLVFGEHNIFVLSLFSFIPALVIIAVMDKWLMTAASLTSLKFSPEERFAAAIMTGTSAMYLGMSVILRMDMLMCMFIILSLFTFYKMYKGVGNLNLQRFLLPFYIFMALFSKGPVGLLMPLLSIFFFLLFMGRLRETGKYLGWRTWLVLILLSGAWLLGVWIEGGSEYLNNLLFHQTIDRAVDAAYHKEPFWFYIPALFYTLAPFSLLAVLCLVKSFVPKGFVTDAEKLMLVSACVTFIMLSCFSSKLPIYLAPIFPLLIYMSVFANRRCGWNAGLGTVLWIPAILLLLAGIAAAAAPSLVGRLAVLQELEKYAFISSPFVYVAAAMLVIFSGLAIRSLVRKSWTGAVSFMGMSLLFAVLAASPMLPQVNDYIGYGNLCSAAKEIKDSENLSGYSTFMMHRPENMDVYLGEDVAIFDDGEDSVNGFVESGLNGSVLMLKTSSLDGFPALADRLSGALRTTVGDYGIYVLP